MQQQGLIRKIDPLGRVTIPIEYRRQYDLMIGDLVEIVGTEQGVFIHPHVMACIFCKGTKNVQEHMGQLVCEDCIKFFKRLGNTVKETKVEKL